MIIKQQIVARHLKIIKNCLKQRKLSQKEVENKNFKKIVIIFLCVDVVKQKNLR